MIGVHVTLATQHAVAAARLLSRSLVFLWPLGATLAGLEVGSEHWLSWFAYLSFGVICFS